MEFGRAPYEGLTEADFILSIKPQPYLPGKRFDRPKMHIGFSKWKNKHWQGNLYPANTKESDSLKFYSKQFNAVELNASRYHIPSVEQVQKWVEKTDLQDFTFCPTFPKLITHTGPITVTSKSAATDKYLTSILTFADNLGPALLQVNDLYKINQKPELFAYLKSLPKDILVFTETRHSSWFSSEQTIADTTTQFHEMGIGWTITDTPGRRDVVHLQLSIPKTIIRFVCQGDTELDMFRIAQWKILLADWFNNGLQDCWFFLHVHNEEVSYDFAKYVQSEFYSLLK